MKVEFWFEFASTYSYLSVMRLPDLAIERDIEVAWRPFLLGPIFAAQGLTDSPFNIYPSKGAYMWRDMERRATALGLAFQRTNPFPQNGLLAARVATAALPDASGVRFCQNIFSAQFADGLNISDPAVVSICAQEAGLPLHVQDIAASDKIKAQLRATTQNAQNKGIFGAPSVTVGKELFWGDDRLEDALNWAAKHA